MKAITIKQPWASLIVHGIKDIENRTWRKVCQNAHLLFFTHKAPTFTSWGFVIT